MSIPSIGFVGGGRVTRIILQGWRRANALPGQIVVSDPNPEPLAKLSSDFPQIQFVTANSVPAAQDIVFLAVHPPLVADVLATIAPNLKPEALVISLAPKFNMAKLTELLGGFARLARMIPNAPSLVNLGFNPVAFAANLGAAERSDIISLIAPLGECPEVPETQLEAYAILTAMGPTYLWFQLQALREVAAGLGLSEPEITPALRRMVIGATRTLLESDLTPSEVMDLIPVKPLAEMEMQVTELYRTRLPSLFQKIKP